MSPRRTQGQSDGEEGVHVLWAPWRMRYIEEVKPGDCIFCTPTDADVLRAQLILGTTPHSRIMLNKYPYNNGHLLVAPHRHAALLAELSEREYSDLMTLLRRAVAVIETTLHPQGVNVGLNLGSCAGAGVTDHLHWHVVPRWNGDTNFMPVIGAVKVMPQHLLESYDQLRPFFAPSQNLVGGGSDER
jgi:ATP adenylyltransferase